jgi:hypothetical protein
MKKFTIPSLIVLMFVAALTLWAADVWVKPYTDWSDKDIQKIMIDSPWAKKVSVAFDNLGGGGGGGGRGGRGPQGGSVDPGVDGEGGGGGGGGRGGRGGGGGGDAGGIGGGIPEAELMVRWQSAATVQQALVKAKYGDKAATSEDAQKQLQTEQEFYVIWVAGLPATVRPADDVGKKALLQVTTLSAKDKDSIMATDVVFNTPSGAGRSTDAHFVFPRKTAFTADDKEVEFATKFGKSAVKTRFNLKAMVVNGKLGL